jgi:VanZ family protein
VRPLVRLLPALLWLGLVITLSSLPLRGPDLGSWDKAAHLGEYLVLSVLVVAGLHAGGIRRLFLRTLVAVPIMALVAAADELHQRWIPGRSGDVLDLAADVAGIVLGAGLVLAIVWWRGRRGDG